MLGVTSGLAITALAVGVLLYTKKFSPHEVAVQQRHDGGSSDVGKATVVAEWSDAGARSTVGRRPLIRTVFGARAMGLEVGVFRHRRVRPRPAGRAGEPGIPVARLHPQDGDEVVARTGQEGFNFGDYYARSDFIEPVGPAFWELGP